MVQHIMTNNDIIWYKFNKDLCLNHIHIHTKINNIKYYTIYTRQNIKIIIEINYFIKVSYYAVFIKQFYIN